MSVRPLASLREEDPEAPCIGFSSTPTGVMLSRLAAMWPLIALTKAAGAPGRFINPIWAG